MPSSNPLVARFREGGLPDHVKAAAARGALPVATSDLVEILSYLEREPSPELRRDILTTLAGMPDDALSEVVAAPDCAPAMLDFVARTCAAREAVVERLLQNAATSDATAEILAQAASASMLEFLSFNQVRLERAPGIMRAMLANPRLPTSVRRRLQEIWDIRRRETVGRDGAPAERKAQAEPEIPTAETVAEPGPSPAAPRVAAAVPSEIAAETARPPVAAEAFASTEASEGLPEGALDELGAPGVDQQVLEAMREDQATEEELRLAQRLLMMNVPEKVQLALKGDREARMVLIRDASKQVQEAVINSPKLTDNEVERISNMRSISEDVIRLLSNKREAMKIYSVAHNLVRNPKTPQPIAMTLMQRLQNRDLIMVTKDKNIPDVVRRHALITLEKRSPKAPPGKKK